MAPLHGLRIVEFAGLGPGPFAAMLLADLGAEVVRVDRPSVSGRPRSSKDVLGRNRRNVCLDLKDADQRRLALELIAQADVVIEGFRPGVMERLGLGPGECAEENPRLIYARMTGWGQTGPYRHVAGHDINYIALAGVLAHLATPDGRPTPPLNLVGDFGGGSMYLVFGILAAVIERATSGYGQVVDAAMVDGAASLMSLFWSFRGVPDAIHGVDESRAATRMLDGGAPYYGVYECADGKYVSVGAIEPQFYAVLVGAVGLSADPNFAPDRQNDRARWDAQRARLREVFLTRSRDEWCKELEHTDACFAPVLTMSEALDHQHNIERGTFIDVDGVVQPGPAPRFSRSTPAPTTPASFADEDPAALVEEWRAGSSASTVG